MEDSGIAMHPRGMCALGRELEAQQRGCGRLKGRGHGALQACSARSIFGICMDLRVSCHPNHTHIHELANHQDC